jgi:hypothetical protein
MYGKYKKEYEYEFKKLEIDVREEGIEKDLNSPIYSSILDYYSDNQLKYREMVEKLKLFKSDDDEINKIHKELINAYDENSKLYKEKIEIEALYKNQDIEIDFDDVINRLSKVNNKLDQNSIENTWNNLGSLLGIEY